VDIEAEIDKINQPKNIEAEIDKINQPKIYRSYNL